LLSDISYSNSEDSSYDQLLNNPKQNSALIKKNSAGKIFNDLNTKKCAVNKIFLIIYISVFLNGSST